MQIKQHLSQPQPQPPIDCKLMRGTLSENHLAYSQSTTKFVSKIKIIVVLRLCFGMVYYNAIDSCYRLFVTYKWRAAITKPQTVA